MSSRFISKARGAVFASALPALLTLAVPEAQAAYTGLYVFGDSLSDTGNVFTLSGGTFPPIGPNPSQPYYFNGRFSNGPVWVEYLAPQLGFPYNPATNFALGGATTGSANTGVPLPLGLSFELGLFQTLYPQPDASSLYILLAGANDYLGGGVRDPFQPVNNLTNAIRFLAGQGARDILVPNLPDLGQLPGTRTTDFAASLTALTNAHNALLAGTLQLLSQELGPQVNLIAFDVNGLLNNAIANPGQYGFSNVTDPCLSPPPLSPFTPPNTPATICANPNQYLFWDDIHPSTAAHALIADAALESINAQAVPEPPATLGLFAFGAFLGATTMLKRRSLRKPLEMERENEKTIAVGTTDRELLLK